MSYGLLPIVVPVFVLAIVIAFWLRIGKEPRPRLWFLLVSGSVGIFAVLLPGLVAAREMVPAPSVAVWLVLMIFCLIGLLIGLSFARFILRRFWLDE